MPRDHFDECADSVALLLIPVDLGVLAPIASVPPVAGLAR